MAVIINKTRVKTFTSLRSVLEKHVGKNRPAFKSTAVIYRTVPVRKHVAKFHHFVQNRDKDLIWYFTYHKFGRRFCFFFINMLKVGQHECVIFLYKHFVHILVQLNDVLVPSCILCKREFPLPHCFVSIKLLRRIILHIVYLWTSLRLILS